MTKCDALDATTQYTRAGGRHDGESRDSHVWGRQWQLSDTLSWTRGRAQHEGGRQPGVRHSSGGDGNELGGAFVLGQFTINSVATAPINQLTMADVTAGTRRRSTTA